MIRVPDGLLVVDKPSGPTSHDIVARVRRALGGAKVGHGGTLDPFATGVLPLVIGRATRLVRFLSTSPKVYRGEIELGLTTATDDVTGAVVARHDGPAPDPQAVLGAAAGLVGRTLQVPPSVSAKRIGGERSYRRARRGEAVLAPPSEVEVFRFDLGRTSDPIAWTFEAEVSSGTYIRALARDLGTALGCGGSLRSLRRTATGALTLEHALRIGAEELPDRERLVGAIVAMERMPLTPPPCRIGPADVARFVSGNRLPAPPDAPGSGPVRVLLADEQLLGVGEMIAGTLVPRVVLTGAPPADSLPGAPRV